MANVSTSKRLFIHKLPVGVQCTAVRIKFARTIRVTFRRGSFLLCLIRFTIHGLSFFIITNGEDCLRGGIILQLRPVNLQPQTLRALRVGDDLGL